MTRRNAHRNRARCPILASSFFAGKGGKPQRPAIAIRLLLLGFLTLALFLLAACHSYHIDATIENRTGADIQLLEVDYPSASFGADRLAAGAVYHYRFQVRDSGPLKITYTPANGQQVQITGPTLVEREQGQLDIVLLPAGRAEFHPQLTPTP